MPLSPADLYFISAGLLCSSNQTNNKYVLLTNEGQSGYSLIDAKTAKYSL